MKNKDFFFLQYNKINWKKQEETKINSFINNYIIKNVIAKQVDKKIAIFDIGFGIGFFFEQLLPYLEKSKKDFVLEGCEPSKVNYEYFTKHIAKQKGVKGFKKTFQLVKTKTKFDFVTAIYVFPHFPAEDLEAIVKKVYSMLKRGGKFVLVLADERYLENKLKAEKDLYIEKNKIIYKGKEYKEILHYSDIPKIGKVIDYNREELYYRSLFKDNGFDLANKETLNDNGFICTLFVFKKSGD